MKPEILAELEETATRAASYAENADDHASGAAWELVAAFAAEARRDLAKTTQLSAGSKQQPEGGAVVRSSNLLAIATAALERIAKCENAPDIDATGEWQTGLHCGVEDRDCRDRYDGADFGHMIGVEKGLKWASNEAKHALGQMASTLPDAVKYAGMCSFCEGSGSKQLTLTTEEVDLVCYALRELANRQREQAIDRREPILAKESDKLRALADRIAYTP